MPKQRRSTATEVDYENVLARIAEGQSIASIAPSTGLSESGLRYKLIEEESLAARYARAREAQAHHFAERIADMATNATDPALDRLRMDALKWTAARILPKAYGDKITQEHTGANGGPIQMTDEAMREKLAHLMERLAQKP